MLAIIWPTKVLCNHSPLYWLFSAKNPNSKLVRWRLKLKEFDYEIRYKKGKININANALSRTEINTKAELVLEKYMEKLNDRLSQEELDNLPTQNNPPYESEMIDSLTHFQREHKQNPNSSTTTITDETNDLLQGRSREKYNTETTDEYIENKT